MTFRHGGLISYVLTQHLKSVLGQWSLRRRNLLSKYWVCVFFGVTSIESVSVGSDFAHCIVSR